MLETVNRVTRATALAATASAGTPEIAPLPDAARFALRLRPALASEMGAVAGFPLDLAINSASSGPRRSIRLGPDEWLLIGDAAEAEAIAAEIAQAFGERFHALVEISHRNVGIAVRGAHAADVLNAGCPLDLAAAAFPTGFATRTLLGKAEIVLIREDDAPTYRVECWRSFAPYVHGFLLEAARDFDGAQT
ncbi:sarcosine oxidase subunit gamma [Kaistia terrae]|uniref:Sarcosine oxidase subunit gamma n=1 Tax=Kaistia terrae TaxID=537017 RepID=A0ABW0PPV1_9HYPH|nr:sarcosine oxidase subunit gamma family protein [Kaistia terrae]MCX5577901.1 sarcosine oxidase subunit gamma [Kaistia terrae]